MQVIILSTSAWHDANRTREPERARATRVIRLGVWRGWNEGRGDATRFEECSVSETNARRDRNPCARAALVEQRTLLLHSALRLCNESARRVPDARPGGRHAATRALESVGHGAAARSQPSSGIGATMDGQFSHPQIRSTNTQQLTRLTRALQCR